jgi:hypothetical protein
MSNKPYVVVVRVHRQYDDYIEYSFNTISKAQRFQEAVTEKWLVKTSLLLQYK